MSDCLSISLDNTDDLANSGKLPPYSSSLMAESPEKTLSQPRTLQLESSGTKIYKCVKIYDPYLQVLYSLHLIMADLVEIDYYFK